MSNPRNSAKSFLSHIEAKPYDPVVKLTFADWLEEREEDNGLVTVMRWCAYNGKHPGRVLGGYLWAEESDPTIGGANILHYSLPTKVFDQLNLYLVGTGWEDRFIYSSMLQAFEALVGKVSLTK